MHQTLAKWLLGLAAFLVLDWATFTPDLAPLGITPWNPAIGLAVAIVFVGGRIFVPLLVVGPLISDIFVRSLPFPFALTLLEASLVGTGYWAGITYLLRPATRFDRRLLRLRDLLLLGAVTAIAAFAVALAYTVVLVIAGYLESSRLVESVVRYWSGDVIGLMVMTPFLLLIAYRREFPQITIEGVLQSAAILGTVLIVFGIAGKPQLQLSFLLLVPIMWLAVRYGFEGVAAGLLVMQVCIMVALHVNKGDAADVTLFQAIMAILALSGLAIGQLVSERGEGERRLRRQQDAIARAARLGSMGELAAAVAHEINQPLTAASNYARATVALLKGDAPRIADARLAAERLIEQVDRSAQVIRRLRELIRSGRLTVQPESVYHLLQESLDLMAPAMQNRHVPIELDVAPGLPLVAVDLIQIEQVLTNLMRNSLEALEDNRPAAPRILLSAHLQGNGFVAFAVSDNGPGFPDDFDIADNRTLASSKPDGLGVGLSVCQSIIEAHGGIFEIERGSPGATVWFTVPIAKEVAHA